MSLAWFLPLPGSYAGVDAVGVYNFACSLREVLAKHPFLPHGCGLFSGSYFPSFLEGLSLRPMAREGRTVSRQLFPFLLGGAFIEAESEREKARGFVEFPFLLGGAFIEARAIPAHRLRGLLFPFLLGGAFIEAVDITGVLASATLISLPSWRGFH